MYWYKNLEGLKKDKKSASSIEGRVIYFNIAVQICQSFIPIVEHIYNIHCNKNQQKTEQ